MGKNLGNETGNLIRLKLVRSRNNERLVYERMIDLNEYNIRPAGLLDQILRSVPSPLNCPYFSLFHSTITVLRFYPKGYRLLSLPISELEEVDIQTLFTTAEHAIEEKLVKTGRYKSGARPSLLFRRVVKYLEAPLKDGSTLISDVDFKTRFKDDISPRSLLSESVDVAFDDPELAAPISVLKADNYSALQEKAQHHLNNRKKRISDACFDVLKKYQEFQKRLSSLSDTRLSGVLEAAIERFDFSNPACYEAIPNLSLEARLHFVIRLFTVHHLFEYESFKQTHEIKQIGKVGKPKRLLMAFVKPLSDLSEARSLCIYHPTKIIPVSKSGFVALSLIRSLHIIPASVICCMRILLQLETDWNISTCYSITDATILETANGFHIKATKPKTSQEFSLNSSRSVLNTSSTHTVISLLAGHSKALNRLWVRSSDSVFAGLILNHPYPTAKIVSYRIYQNFFEALYNIPTFTADQLRDQGLNSYYLDTQDIHALMSRAGWSDVGTAEQYIGQTIIRVLSDANISRYMQRLESSIVWAAKGNELLERLKIEDADIDKKLLFPIQTDAVSSRNSLVDEWLSNDEIRDDSHSVIPIIITEDRIKHTCRQAAWYRKYWHNLFSANQDRFISIHLPRILICLALEKLIVESEYSALYCV